MADVTHSQLITEVRLSNFKSIANQTVQMRPLTVVIGANSSGKSTLVQSLLLLTQAVEAGSTSPDVPLNGDRVNLGFLAKVRNSGVLPSTPVSVGVTASFTPSGRATMLWYGDVFDDLEDVRRVPWTAKLDIQFGGKEGTDIVSAPLVGLQLVACPQEATTSPDAHGVCLDLTRRGVRASRPNLDDVVMGFPFSPINEATSELIGHVHLEEAVRTKVIGVSLRGLLPVGLLQNKPEHAALAESFFDHLFRRGYAVFVDDDSTAPRPKPDISEFLDLASARLNEWRSLPSEERPQLAQHLREVLSQDELRSVPIEQLHERRAEYVKTLTRMLAPSERRSLPVGIRGRQSAFVNLASRGLAEVFRSIEHLGGLRAAPQPLYPTSNQAQRGHLGRDGEYTAAVLYALRDRMVASFDEHGDREDATLQDAVRAWAVRLGLFEEVDPHHRGALGIDITIRQAGVSSDIDITAVGLGVSQLLPVLVRCLLSGPEEIVLLEQPELHLHPESQQRLADFLLACVRSGRQLVVETHSEHLVNRLRLHAARDKSSEIDKLMTLVFAERDQELGETTYSNVDINPFGGLSEWPQHFMAEGISDARELLTYGLEKLKESTS